MIDIIKACTDLGTHVCGAEFGPDVLLKDFQHEHIHKVYSVQKQAGEKELAKENKKKNINRINTFNEELYKRVQQSLEEGKFPLIIGGDHSLAIGSALASNSINQSMGIIWVDAHADYHTFDTTITGNIHGLPLATITGQVPEGLTAFHHGGYISPENTVLVGARSIDMPQEMMNLEKAGVHVFLDEDVKRLGIIKVMEEAFQIASNGTNGVHVSLDVDVVNPIEAPGVSIPEEGGLSKNEFSSVIDSVISHKNLIKSLDLVEFNPSFDKNQITYQLVFHELSRLVEELL